MLTIALGTISFLILGAEFYLGMAVTGWQGDDIIVERNKAPGLYWMWMALHTTVCIGLPVLSWLAGV
ncbi:MAG: hypothetical protein AAFN77_24605 [Planctomycetota bacterium]